MVKTSDMPFAAFCALDVFIQGMRQVGYAGRPTTRRNADDCIRADNVIGPRLAAGLDFAEIVLLRIVEVFAMVIVARTGLLYRDFDGAQMHTVMLDLVSRLISKECILLYFSASLETDSL